MAVLDARLARADARARALLSAGRARHYTAGLAVGAAPLVLDIAVLLALGWAGVTSVGAQLLAVTVVNAVATAARFVVLRRWVFR